MLARPDVIAQFAKLGLEITAMPAREFATFMSGDVQKWIKLTRELQIKAE